METKEQKTGDALAAALDKIADSQKAIAESVTKQAEEMKTLGGRLDSLEKGMPKPVELSGIAEQTREQAFEGERKAIADRAEAAKTAEDREKAYKEMEAKLAELEKEKEELRTAVDLRKSGYSLGDAKDALEGRAGVGREKALEFWNGLKAKGAGGRWEKDFPGRTPEDVLIHGAHETKTLSGRVAGTGASVVVDTLVPLPIPDSEIVREAQTANDEVFLWMLIKQAQSKQINLAQCPFVPRMQKAMEVLGKALNSTTMANWIPTGFSAQVFEKYELARNLTKLIPAVQMPHSPWDMYVSGARPAIRATSSLATTNDPETATRITSSVVQPLKTTLALHGFAIRIPFDKDAEEDSIPALLPRILLEIALAWKFYEEDIYMNSSSAANHIDVDVTGATHHLKTVDGMRPLALSNSYTSALASAQDAEGMISTCLSAMGIFGANPADLVCAVGPKVRAKLLTMKTNAGYPVIIGSATLAPLPNAMTLGEIPSIAGSPLVVVEAARENLNASGFYDGTTATKGTIMWFNRRGPIVGYRNLAGETMTTLEPASLQTDLVYYVRREFEDLLPIASNHWVHLGTGLSF